MSVLTINPIELRVSNPDRLNEVIGPIIPFDVRIWQALVDYRKWALWMEGVREVSLTDVSSQSGGGFGRGSTFHLHGAGGVNTLEILHWSPSQRLVYSVGPPQQRIACCYEVDYSIGQSQATVRISAEAEVSGSRRLVSVLLKRRYQNIFTRQSQRLAALLMDKTVK